MRTIAMISAELAPLMEMHEHLMNQSAAIMKKMNALVEEMQHAPATPITVKEYWAVVTADDVERFDTQGEAERMYMDHRENGVKATIIPPASYEFEYELVDVERFYEPAFIAERCECGACIQCNPRMFV